MKKIEKKSKLTFTKFEVVKLNSLKSVMGGTGNHGGPVTDHKPPQSPSSLPCKKP